MAVVDLTGMTALTTTADGDILYIVDDPGGSPLPRKVTVGDLLRRAYGEILIDDGTGNQALTAATWTKVTQFDENGGNALNVTEDNANDKLTLTNAGIYVVHAAIACTTGAAANLDIAVYWNGSATKARAEADSPDGTTIVALSTGAHVLSVGTGATDIELYAHMDISDDLAVTQASLAAFRLG